MMENSIFFSSLIGIKVPEKDVLPLPTMTKGALAAFKMETASLTALWSAKLTGGGGQQDTTLKKNLKISSQGVLYLEHLALKPRITHQRKTTNLTWFLSTLALTMSPAMST